MPTRQGRISQFLRYLWDGFWTAWAFLTVVRPPVPFRWNPDGAPVFFGVVGLLRGVLLWGWAGIVIAVVPGRPWVWALTVTVGEVLLTGALHLDGWADSWDALWGHRTRDEVLRILKDVHLGVWGGTALTLDLLARVVLTATLPEDWFQTAWLLAPMAGTLAMLGPMVGLRDVRGPEGLAYAFSRRRASAWVGIGVNLLAYGASAGVQDSGFPFVLPLAAVGGVAAAWTGYLAWRLGGYTGDTLGAAHEWGLLVWLWAVHAMGRAVHP
ncbi:MAG: adenosylcobinamide-GDP ribazoletransferase [Acidobacteria bacterium]|nr:adenosylcobinamide-GDP ribazoletransferase [Acidobacteriota bacterium]MDW7984042.1 adenosylcobinamide-GDP ribazoletransferase [Acidobacteriota bacterium]